MSENLGDRIRQIRQNRKQTMKEFGESFEPEASKGVVSNWENGYNRPNKKRLEKIASWGKYNNVNELLYGTGKDFIKNILLEDIEKEGKFYNVIVQYLIDTSQFTFFGDEAFELSQSGKTEEVLKETVNDFFISSNELILEYIDNILDDTNRSTSTVIKTGIEALNNLNYIHNANFEVLFKQYYKLYVQSVNSTGFLTGNASFILSTSDYFKNTFDSVEETLNHFRDRPIYDKYTDDEIIEIFYMNEYIEKTSKLYIELKELYKEYQTDKENRS